MTLGRRDIALFVLIMLCTYLRPGQLLSVRGTGLTPPTQGVTAHWSLLVHPEELVGRSKIGDANVSILLDSSWAKWIGPAMKELKETAGDGPLWTFDYGDLLKFFRRAARDMGVPKLVPYQARHSGPSIDAARHLRTLADIKKRGQWRADKSVLRYERHARLASGYRQHPSEVQRYASECERRAEAIIPHGLVVPQPRKDGRL